jgi:hypothetical protein
MWAKWWAARGFGPAATDGGRPARSALGTRARVLAGRCGVDTGSTVWPVGQWTGGLRPD